MCLFSLSNHGIQLFYMLCFSDIYVIIFKITYFTMLMCLSWYSLPVRVLGGPREGHLTAVSPISQDQGRQEDGRSNQQLTGSQKHSLVVMATVFT